MKHTHGLTLALLAGMSLAGCSQPPAPPAPPAAPAPPVASANDSFIGRHVGGAIEQARKELATQNISISDGMNINVNGREWKTGDGTLPKAEITPQGDLLIEGKAVAITPSQRTELLAYRGQVLGIAEAGMAIGAQGANIAGHAISGAVGAIFGGKDGEKEFEKKIEAEAAKIEAEAMKLCTRLPALMAGQQTLAASLPEFKPYARMTLEDIEDCGKDVGKGKGVAVTSG
jgi:hypothetical protein